MRRILHLAAATLAAHLSYSITDGTRIGSYIGNIVQDLSEISLTSSSAIFQVVKGADVINVSPEGDLRVITEIDRENGQLCSKDDHTCLVDAEILYRKDKEFKLFYVDLEIVDINDNRPEFEKSSIELHLPENSAIGSTIRLPSADDPDSSEFSIDRYQVSPAMFFDILPRQHANGKIIPQLVLKRPLDFEKRELHELELVAFDKGGLTGSMKINLLVDDVNDHSPIFEESSVSIELSESTAMGSVIYKLNASDGDRGRYGVISYSYDDVLTDALSRTIFAINSSTGDITVSSELNYEKQKKHVLYIEAFDGSESALMTVTINIFNVNDNPPEIDIKFGESSVEGSISENAPVGSFVGFVSITDSDKDQKLNVSLVNDDGDFELENMSDSEGSNGYILKVAKPLDRERVHLYRIDLRAADNGSPPLTTTKTVSIKVEDVNDNAPFFQRDMYHVNILENNNVGKSIVSLKATDVDEGQNAEIEYILGEESSFFSLERGTGDLIALQSLDAELNSRHVVRIIAVDRGSPSLKGETSVVINVLDENDNDPAFEQVEYDFFFPENTEEGEKIGTVTAIDADKKSEVRYRLASNSVPFRISPQTGSITLQRSIDADIDNTKYEIMIIAEDKDGRSATASVTIIVNDINDNAPVLIWPNPDLDIIQVTLDRKVSEKVGTIKVRDRDQGANGEIIITQIKPRSGMFQINSAGEVFLASKLKRSNLGANPVLISISDGGSPPLQINSRVSTNTKDSQSDN